MHFCRKESWHGLLPCAATAIKEVIWKRMYVYLQARAQYRELPEYRILCPACSMPFPSYEKYVGHVFKDHADQPALRMKAKIIRG